MGVGLSTLNKWVQKHQHDTLMSSPHEDVENTLLRKEGRLLREERVVLKKVVARVSDLLCTTQRQGESGLGLEAQREAVNRYAEVNVGSIVASFVEIESGKRSDRPELEAALAVCRKSGAVLLIAKLDRLARNVHFMSGLIESGVNFIATDMPTADRFMLHVYAAMAEEEARKISDRTKKALAAAKARGVKLGEHGKLLSRREKTKADAFASELQDVLRKLLKCDGLSFRDAATQLNNMGIATARGGSWHSTSVHRTWSRLGA